MLANRRASQESSDKPSFDTPNHDHTSETPQISLQTCKKRKEQDSSVETGTDVKRRISGNSVQSDTSMKRNSQDTEETLANQVQSQQDRLYARSNKSHNTRGDEEMAASALVSMCDVAMRGLDPAGDECSASIGQKQNAVQKQASKNRNKTVTALCYECGVEQTSHFRPVVSDFIGKKSKSSETFPRVEVCNKCYCKMAPRMSEYAAWRIGMLKKQIVLYHKHGIQEFDISREHGTSKEDVEETLSLLDALQEMSRTGASIGVLKVRPIIVKHTGSREA